jgi:hypothetical protein
MPVPYEPTYCVWRRSDGYVDASAGSSVPRGWTFRGWTFREQKTGALVTVTFEELLVTKDWRGASARIRAERVADEMNGVTLAWM